MMNQDIYVYLLDEGVDVWRPAHAIVLENGLFQILPTSDYNPDNERWEFPPGSIVKAIWKDMEHGKALVAVNP